MYSCCEVVPSMYNFIDQKLLKNSTDRDVWPTHLVIICPLKIKNMASSDPTL